MSSTTTMPAFANATGNATDAEEHSFLGLTGDAATGLSAGLAVTCILGAGLASGLNLCLLSLDPDATLADASDKELPESVRSNARKVHNILIHQHWMLVTTLVWNAIFAETNPLILESLLGGILAIVISTVALVIFGEIIPQSCFTRYALSVAGFLSPVVWVMMIVSGPISFPIAKLLDVVVGHRPPVAMKRVELRELIALNVIADSLAASTGGAGGEGDETSLLAGSMSSNADGQKPDNNNMAPRTITANGGVTFTQDEVALLNSALNLSEKTVRDVMKSGEFVESLFMLEENQTLSKDVVRKITENDKTRIPVYQNDRRNITGFIFSHAILHILFMNEATQAPKVKDCGVTSAARCNASDLVVVLFRPFLSDAQDIAVVHDDATGLPLGIVTKWDMLSFLFNDDISAEKWGLQDAEQLAAEARAAQSKRTKRETMVLARNATVSSGLKLVESGLPLSAPSAASAAVSGGGHSTPSLSPAGSQNDLLHAGGGGGGGSSRARSGSWRRSATGAGGHEELRHSNGHLGGGGGHSGYGTGGGGPSAGSMVHAGGGLARRSGRFSSSAMGGGGGGRSSHFVPGDSKRRMPSFVGAAPSSGERD